MAYTTTQLQTFFKNANAGTAASAAQVLTLTALANQNAAGTLTDAQALAQTIDLASDTTTAVSVETYAFFTGVAPSQAGLAYLNGAFVGTGAQAGLNGENRFIAQSVALALGNSAAKTAFSTSYGTGNDFAVATKAAYNIIIGNSAAAAAGINVDNAVAYLTSTSSIAYYTAFVKANVPGLADADVNLAVKAAIVGEIMYLATTYNNGAGIGSYATATTNLIKDLADDGLLTANNTAGIDLFANYGTPATPTPGSTLALTTGLDALVGTANDDTFVAIVGNTTTINFGDTLDGGAGNDTLTIANDKAAGVTVPALTTKNIENVTVNNTVTAGGAADAVTVDASGLAGVTSILSNGLGDVTITNVGTGVSVGIKDVAYTATSAATVTAVGARSVNVSGVTIATGGTATVNVQGIAAQVGTSLSVVNSGKAATITTLKFGGTDAAKTTTLAFNVGAATTIGTLTSGTANELKTITVTGNGALTVSNAIASNVLATIDASTNVGGVTLSVDGTALTSVKGGTGADSITIANALGATAVVSLGDGNDTLTLNTAPVAGAVIDGGAGTDTLGLSANAVLTAGNKASFVNFETVALSGATTYDVSLFSGFANIAVAGGTPTLTNVANNSTFNVTGSATSLTTTLTSTVGTADTVNLNLGVAGKNAGVVSSFVAAGVEQLNINSINGTSGSTPAVNSLKIAAADTDLNKVVVTGAGVFSLDATAITHALNVDATAATGALTVNGAGAASQINVQATGINDNIVAGAAGGQINAGKGGDAITLGAGVDIVILKGGDSVFDTSSNTAGHTAGVSNKGTMDSISGFTSGSDKIDLTQISGFGTTGQGVAQGSAQATVDALNTYLTTTANVFKDGGGLQRGVLQVVVGGADSYVVVDVNHDGIFQASTDLVVKLAGITSALVATDFNFGS